MADLPDFELFINGNKFERFTRGFVRLSIEQAASEFEFSYVDIRVNLDADWPIKAGDACTIKLQDQLLVTGFIDDTSVEYQAGQLTLRARGRSTLGDIVDSSAHFKKGRWKNVTLEQIAKDLCEPFGIEVSIDRVDEYNKRFPKFAIDPGETVMECITRAARYRGLWPSSDPEGPLRLLSPGARVLNNVSLEYGRNIIRGMRSDTYARRHSAYFLRGQSPSDDEANGRTTAQENGAVFDDQIERYRPLIFVSTSQKGKRDLQRRAIWERNRRASQSERVIYNVDGFGFGEGFAREVWMPGSLLSVEDPRLQIDGRMVIAACAFRFAADGREGGRVTDLTLLRKEAFDLLEKYPRGQVLGRDFPLTDAQKRIKAERHAGMRPPTVDFGSGGQGPLL